MINKKEIEQQIKGWIPKEPMLINQSLPSNCHSAYRWTAIALVIGSFAGALLGALGSALGLTSGFGAFLWPIMVGLIIGCSTAVVAIYETNRNKYKEATDK